MSDKRRDKKERSASSSYKKDLDKLFQTGADVPERFRDAIDKLKESETPEEQAWREAVDILRATEGFREFVMEATKFQRAGHTWPDDEDILVRLLDHPNERILASTLAHFVDLHRRRGLERGTAILNRLKTIRSIAESPATLKLADDIENLLNS